MIMPIKMFGTYKEKYRDIAEDRKKLKEKSKARKSTEDFSLIFEKACKEVKENDS